MVTYIERLEKFKADNISLAKKIKILKEQAETEEKPIIIPYVNPRKEEREKQAPIMDINLSNIVVSDGALEVINILQSAGYNADLVGGCVRDAMLGMQPKDEDITTNLKPDEVVKLFKSKGYEVIPTGLQHGTVTIIVRDKENTPTGYEVTTYRIDGQSTDQRHPDSVTFTSDIKEDMSRRDFTINAMAFDPNCTDEKRIKDYYNGRNDLLYKVIRTVGNADDRIKEDALRMMRAIRFSVQKGMTIDESLLQAIKDNAESISKVSKERIYQELTKILMSDEPARGIHLLHETGLLAHISPEIEKMYQTEQVNPWHLYTVAGHTEKVIDNTPKDLVTRTAALFHDIGKPATKSTDSKGIDHFYGHPVASEKMARKIMQELKFSAQEIKDVCLLVELHDNRLAPSVDKVIKFMLKYQNISVENMDRLFDLQKADMAGQNPELTAQGLEDLKKVKDIYHQLIMGPFTTKDLAIDGDDIQAINRSENGNTTILYARDIRIAKDMLLDYVLHDQTRNTQAQLTLFVMKNLRTIKTKSIDSIPIEGLKQTEKELYKIRVAMDKVKKEILTYDVEELKKAQDNSPVLNKFNALNLRYEALLDALKKHHSEKNPYLLVSE